MYMIFELILNVKQVAKTCKVLLGLGVILDLGFCSAAGCRSTICK